MSDLQDQPTAEQEVREWRAREAAAFALYPIMDREGLGACAAGELADAAISTYLRVVAEQLPEGWKRYMSQSKPGTTICHDGNECAGPDFCCGRPSAADLLEEIRAEVCCGMPCPMDGTCLNARYEDRACSQIARRVMAVIAKHQELVHAE